MPLPLDAREILTCLNDMGYRNISAEQLKEFIRDLKRLIKYETIYSKPNEVASNSQQRDNIADVFDKLHLTSTVASRAKLAASRKTQVNHTMSMPQLLKSQSIPHRDCADQRYSARNNAQTTTSTRPDNTQRTSARTQTDLDQPIDARKMPNSILKLARPQSAASSKYQNEIDNKENRQETEKPKSTDAASTRTTLTDNLNNRFIRNTPTDLYQYYQDSWMKFKHCVPGENSRSNVRTAIRKRMEHIQRVQPTPKVYLAIDPTDHHKTIKRF